jgi:FkbM family methyltransferase
VIHAAQRLTAAAARRYVVSFPIARGKGIVLRRIAPKLPVEDREFDAAVPGGGIVVLRWDEVVGRHVLRHGNFAQAEVETARACLQPGDVAVDVGANVGLFTVPLALAVGPGGRVLAVEPLPENVERLETNLHRNGLGNVTVVSAAAGSQDGAVQLQVAADSAFSSVAAVTKYRVVGALRVPCRRLDSLWDELGRPRVALVKIDVEGAELSVLDGAQEMLRSSRPTLLVEADPGAAADALAARLGEAGYVRVTPAGFGGENHLFRPG